MAVKGGTIFRSSFGFTRADEYLTEKMPANTMKITPPEQGEKEEKSEMGFQNATVRTGKK